ncbi:MAG: hypothetical protein KatS3mg024_2526 [Armatimonadota bacterium]|nr:MAG: hypothetical protein KatS3mg024_2526 [Armatimonadota bacterium]
MAARLPLGDDEAFYWLWAQRLAPCYFDHPGMVAWLVALSTAILGDTTLAVRLPTILLGAANAWMMFLLARRFFNERTGLRAASLFTMIPLYALGGFLVASDAPMGLFWLLTLWLVADAVLDGRRNRWYAAGVSLGLALCSKFTAVLLVPSVLLFLASCSTGRRELQRREPWLGALIACVIFWPVLLWNARNEWASFAFNAVGRHQGASLRLTSLAELTGAQLLALSPMVFVSLVAALITLTRLRGSEHRYRLLFWGAVPALVVFWGASLLTRILPHWPAAGYLTLIIACCGFWGGAAGRKASRAWVNSVFAVALIFTALLHIQPFYRILPLPPGDDNTNHLYGWDEVTPVVREEFQRIGGPDRAFLCADRYQFAAQLAWNLRQPLHTFSLNTRKDQFDIWVRPDEILGKDAVLVWEDDWGLKPETLEVFESAEEIRTIPIFRQGVKVRTFHIVRCSNLRRIP